MLGIQRSFLLLWRSVLRKLQCYVLHIGMRLHSGMRLHIVLRIKQLIHEVRASTKPVQVVTPRVRGATCMGLLHFVGAAGKSLSLDLK